MYLLHPAILTVVFYQNPLMHRYSPAQLGFDFTAAVTLSFALAAAVFLLVEKPFMTLEALLLRKAGLLDR